MSTSYLKYAISTKFKIMTMKAFKIILFIIDLWPLMHSENIDRVQVLIGDSDGGLSMQRFLELDS